MPTVGKTVVLLFLTLLGGSMVMVGYEHWLDLLFLFLKKAVGFAGNVASNVGEDLLENRKSFKESLKDNALNEAQRLFTGKGKRSSSSINTRKSKRLKKHDTIFGKS